MRNNTVNTYFSLLLVAIFLIEGCSGKTTLPDWMKPQVRVGSNFLEKNTFVEDTRIGTVTDIKRGELDTSPGLEIGISGNNGTVFVNDYGKLKAYVDFKRKRNDWLLNFEILDLERDGICEFLRLSEAAATYDALLDHKGNEIWTYGSTDSPMDTTAGDIDGDGKLEFIMGNIGSVSFVDRNGKEQWRMPDVNVWHVEIADTTQNGRLEIVHSNAEGYLTIRDKDGKIISKTKPSCVKYFSEFSIIRYPTFDSRECLLISDDRILIIDFDVKTIVATFNSPVRLSSPKAILVQLDKDHPPYLVVFGLLLYQGRELFGLEAVHSVLYIYDSEQNLVFYEIINDKGVGIAAVPSRNVGEEILLVGGTGKVWQYSIKKEINGR